MKIMFKDKLFYILSFISLPLTSPLMSYALYNMYLPAGKETYSLEFSWIEWYFSYVLSSFEFLITAPFAEYGFGSFETYKLVLLNYSLWLIPSFILGGIFYLIVNFFRK